MHLKLCYSCGLYNDLLLQGLYAYNILIYLFMLGFMFACSTYRLYIHNTYSSYIDLLLVNYLSSKRVSPTPTLCFKTQKIENISYYISGA